MTEGTQETLQQPATVPVAAPQRNPRVELALLAILFSIVAAVTVGTTWKLRAIRANRQPDPVVQPVVSDVPAYVPEFSLIDKDGKPVSRGDLQGKPWVANFFFTSCPAQCPAMTMKMAQLQQALPDDTAAKLVSITVDPETDSPQVLAEYAKTFHAKDDRWLFLTGDKQEIIQLAREGFKLPASENPNDHSLRLVLVDSAGQIRGYFDSTDDASVAKLQSQLRALLSENTP